MNNNRIAGEKFYSKVLLFGEYLIVKGARGLAMPLKRYSGHLYFGENEGIGENLSLLEFAEYLSNSTLLKNSIDTELLIADVERGLHFSSTIPSGYGVGSSGALCAAIYHKYGRPWQGNQELMELRDILSLMEGFYHGISSGIDPLISYVQKPMQIARRNQFSVIEDCAFPLLQNIYLVDTGIARKTAPLVHSFLKLTQDKNFKEPMDEMLALNNKIIDSFMAGEEKQFTKALGQLSYLQYLWLDKMIPKAFKKFWLDSFESKKYIVKLCGAGGGGFLLAYCTDKSLLEGVRYQPVDEY